MSSSSLPLGSFVLIDKPQLQAVVDQLKQLGYRTIGPQVVDAAIVYDDLESVEQLPVGYTDQQDGGRYRLVRSGRAWFDYVVGPHSLKNYVFPPRDTLLQLDRVNEAWQVQWPQGDEEPLAVIGPRSCDLHALRVQDRVFLGDTYVDPAYQARRERLFIVAVNCRRAAATCFCHSMKTGPVVTAGFDLALRELEDFLVVEVGSQIGGRVISKADWSPCSADRLEQAQRQTSQLAQQMAQRSADGAGPEGSPSRQRQLDTSEIRDLLMDNLQHPRWQAVGERCLACANCTMVCPTCFCSSVEEVSDLTGDHVSRQRAWASCFTAEHSYMNSGTVRKTIAARYRQWLTHKLATWMDQFGSSGCVGCGRCITWCPVGIDLTEEVAAIRDSSSTAGS